jgi:hypothetical protein
MRVRCLSASPSPEQLAAFGEGYYKNQALGVEPGTTYIVLGLTFHVRSNLYGTNVTVAIDDDEGHLAEVPLCLFEIVDDRASRYWVIRQWEGGADALWPPSFFAEFYHDDLSEGMPEMVSDYERVKRQIETEATAPELRAL